MEGIEWFQIRRASLQHTCTVDERGGFHKQATSSVIDEMMRAKYASRAVGPRPNELREMMRDDHDIPISYCKAWRSRELAREGSVVSLETDFEVDVGQRFKYLFFALGASLNGSSPIAFGIVDGENDNAWIWFFRKLIEVIPDRHDLLFVSDRHNSIYTDIRKVYPMAQHCACVVHLQRNIQAIFKKRLLSYMIRETDEGCASYLTAIGYEHWARSHFPGVRYNIMTSNVVESQNNVLLGARDHLTVPLIECIRATLMDWFATRREDANSCDTTLTPKMEELLAKNLKCQQGSRIAKLILMSMRLGTKKEFLSWLIGKPKPAAVKSSRCFAIHAPMPWWPLSVQTQGSTV
ncbi:uncharacterized protein LOC112085257 [Eutrema salsugineum]|uniref:uncharacterized protein LOC112085257 n=1 Tax=Eutrema salsugineum TaxID=72664 RepID=UPI000CED4FCE|nr:uncharacterized protein LOC112085257 [Eutrema salsugineum]